MEGGIYYSRRIIQANGDVFQIDKLTCSFLDYDEQNPSESYQHQKSGEFYW